MSESEEEEQKQIPVDKPNQRPQQKDYYADHLQQTEESEQQPPLLVVVQGPNKVGKTTLIKTLIKHYTNHKVQDPIGPITVRAGKNARVTFIECPNDIHAMMDLAKVADLALIMIDASIGFEMETFEFISLLNNHGFPNVMGILTHIDYFKDNKQLRKTRKKYKKRFEYEVGSSYKLFYLTGLKNELYFKHEITNLARFISIIRYTPVRWKSEHSFILADRFEQISDDQIAFWGYVRGCTYRINDRVHFVGKGDYTLEDIQILSDPCPIKKGDSTKRTLKQQSKIVYAPLTNLGFLSFDSTAGYITIPEKNVIFTDIQKLESQGLVQRQERNEEEEEVEEEQNQEQTQEGVQMVRELQEGQNKLDDHLNQDVELLDGMLLLDKNKNEPQIQKAKPQRELLRLKDRVNRALSSINTHTSMIPIDEQLIAADLSDLIYSIKEPVNNYDSNRFVPTNLLSREEYVQKLKVQFVTGQSLEEEEENENNQEDEEKDEAEEEIEEEEQNDEQAQKMKEQEKKERQMLVDEMMTANLGLYKRGSYVKMILRNFDKKIETRSPMIIARIEVGEDNLGLVKIRIKKHRWYGNILKSQDPLIFSLGWRRFQSIPTYFVEDQNERYRFLKYTPQYDYCYAVFYGNFAPQNSGVVCTQTLNNRISKFRLAATGVVMELNHQFDIMKKLKLVGEPFKIYKNTALVKGMFNSSLEVSKFVGGMVKTVSGLRGQIKKYSKIGPEGSFRATFEDKIALSDLVFCRTWVKVDIPRFYRLAGDGGQLLKTMWELRQEKKIAPTQNPDSGYREIERVHRNFNALRIPTRLQESLPFESKEKVRSMSGKERIKRMESKLPVKSMLTDKEKEVYSMIQRLNTLKREKDEKRSERDFQKKKIQESRERGMKQQMEQKKKEFKKQKAKDKFKKQSKKAQQDLE